MKNLKISLTAVLSAIILTVSTSVFAYLGMDLDKTNGIIMPTSLSNGTGIVGASVGGDMLYDFVEINANTYSTLLKLQAKENLARSYVAAERAKWQDASLTNAYETTLAKYQATYGQDITQFTQEYGESIKDSNPRINEVTVDYYKSEWIYNLPDRKADTAMTRTSDRTIKLDLSTFDGTKYFVAWVKIGDTYDAEAYKVVGKKVDEPKEEPKNEIKNEVKNETKNEVEPTPAENNTTAPAKVDNTTKNTAKKADQTKTTKTIPYTGAGSVVGLIALAGAATGFSYKKYSKIN